MQRNFFALLSGGIFGLGLLISGMVDTLKVQGWLDVFGNWDPTLAFVMGGAILPMAVAWQVAARRKRSVLGYAFPEAPKREVGPNLVIGSVLFGMGWALAGLCPGPAIASISFGGTGGLVFLLAMLAGMLIAPAVRARIDGTTAPVESPRTKMDIRALTPTYAVSPQIMLEDLPAIKAAGFTTVIDNRPDAEIPASLHAAHMRAAAEALGLEFVENQVISGGLTAENVEKQAAALAAAKGPVFAYCASGNRCSIVWALVNAGKRPTDELINVPAQYGYNLEHLRAQIEARAKG
jgi:uncharacterized protein (TIGR01244 family)